MELGSREGEEGNAGEVKEEEEEDERNGGEATPTQSQRRIRSVFGWQTVVRLPLSVGSVLLSL